MFSSFLEHKGSEDPKPESIPSKAAAYVLTALASFSLPACSNEARAENSPLEQKVLSGGENRHEIALDLVEDPRLTALGAQLVVLQKLADQYSKLPFEELRETVLKPYKDWLDESQKIHDLLLANNVDGLRSALNESVDNSVKEYEKLLREAGLDPKVLNVALEVLHEDEKGIKEYYSKLTAAQLRNVVLQDYGGSVEYLQYVIDQNRPEYERVSKLEEKELRAWAVEPLQQNIQMLEYYLEQYRSGSGSSAGR